VVPMGHRVEAQVADDVAPSEFEAPLGCRSTQGFLQVGVPTPRSKILVMFPKSGHDHRVGRQPMFGELDGLSERFGGHTLARCFLAASCAVALFLFACFPVLGLSSGSAGGLPLRR